MIQFAPTFTKAFDAHHNRASVVLARQPATISEAEASRVDQHDIGLLTRPDHPASHCGGRHLPHHGHVCLTISPSSRKASDTAIAGSATAPGLLPQNRPNKAADRSRFPPAALTCSYQGLLSALGKVCSLNVVEQRKTTAFALGPRPTPGQLDGIPHQRHVKRLCSRRALTGDARFAGPDRFRRNQFNGVIQGQPSRLFAIHMGDENRPLRSRLRGRRAVEIGGKQL